MVWEWSIVVWVACAVTVIAAERVMSRYGTALWDSNDKGSSALAYGLVVLFSPIALLIVLGMAVKAFLENPKRFLSMVTRKPYDPLSEPENEWIDQGQDTFIGDLIRRRQTRDRRLKGQNIGNWMLWQFKDTPEAMILSVCTTYLVLHDAKISDDLIWERLEARRYEKGEDQLPSPCDLARYVEYRLSIEDEDYLGLGSGFIQEQVELCLKYARHRVQKSDERDWPPLEWLERKLSLAEFERLGAGVDPVGEGAPAALHMGGDSIRSELADLKLLILPGDELWTFSSPQEYWAGLAGRCGIVLIRNNQPVAHVITAKN